MKPGGYDFQDLRNIEAAFFISAWFVLPSIQGMGKLFTIAGRMDCILSLASPKIN